MSELHTVNKSPFEKSSLATAVTHVLPGSAMLFYEDGVYAATKGTAVESKITGANGVKFYALGGDLKARGIGADRVIDGIEIIDYDGFVDLAADHDKVVAWV